MRCIRRIGCTGILKESETDPRYEVEPAPQEACRLYSDCRKAINCCCCAGVKAVKLAVTPCAYPPCRKIAYIKVVDALSCMKRDFMCRPHNGTVRSLFAVSAGPTWTIPSPRSEEHTSELQS